MDLNLIYITTRDSSEARSIGQTVVKEHLAACANILPSMNSFYHWNGSLQEDQESVLILKTRQSLLPELIKRVKELHSYTVPCILALPITGGNEEYLQWIVDETKEAGSHGPQGAEKT